MGSWSETCGFSGMEIGEGEVAYCLLMSPTKHGSLNDGGFQFYTPVTTLLRGTYNDYGYLKVEEDEAILAIFNEQAQLELKNGDDFSLEHLDGRPDIHRWWIHGRAFDFMPSIKPDFPYAVDYDEDEKYRRTAISSVGEAQEVWFASVAARLAKRISELKAIDASDEDAALHMALLNMRMSDILGYRSSTLNRPKLIEELLAGDGQPRLDAYRRITTLQAALFELRKTLARCESAGPQHGGAEASIQFANFLIEAQAERSKRWGE